MVADIAPSPASMESDKDIPLVNGGRDSKSESPEASPEKQPCLPAGDGRPPAPRAPLAYDETDAKRQKLSGSSNSIDKPRAGSFEGRGRWGARVESRLRRRTGLSRPGLILASIILALLLIFFIVVVVLACTWPKTPHEHLFPVCTKSACLRASAQILPKMNASAEACRDFWTHSCGGWLRSQEIPPSRTHWSHVEEQALAYREHLRTIVQTLPYPTDPKTIAWKLMYLYESCMHLDNIEGDGDRPMRKLITVMGGWSVLPDFSPYNWDSQKTFVKLFQAQTATPFFHVGVVPDPQDPTRSIIKILPAGLDLPDKSYYYRAPVSSFVPPSGEMWSVNVGHVCVDLSNVTSLKYLFKQLSETNVPTAYMQYLRSTALNLGAKSSDADRFAEDMFYYQRRITEIMPDVETLENPMETQRVKIGSLKLTAPSVPILDILQAMFPKVGVHQNTDILVPSASYLTELSRLISTSDRSPLNNYMMWIFMSSYIPYLNRRFVDVMNIYKTILTGSERPLDRWEMCISTLDEYMGFALAVKSEQSMDITKKIAIQKQVEEMFDMIRDTVRSSIAKASWFDKELQELALAKMNTMTLQIGVFSPIVTDEYVTKYYELLLLQKNDLLENIRNARDFQQSCLVEKLMRPKEEYSWIDVASNGKTVTYIPTSNKVVIPHWLLLPPYYHSEYPHSLQYGRLGVQIAYAVVSSVLPWYALYDDQGILQNETIANQTEDSVRRAKSFMRQFLISSGLASDAVADRTALTTVIHTAAVKQAHKAMLDALSPLPHVHQPGMEAYESEQLFFLSYAQNLCSKSTPRQEDIDVTTSQHLNGSQLLPATLKQLKEFSDAFSCPATSAYYASSPCPNIL